MRRVLVNTSSVPSLVVRGWSVGAVPHTRTKRLIEKEGKDLPRKVSEMGDGFLSRIAAVPAQTPEEAHDSI